MGLMARLRITHLWRFGSGTVKHVLGAIAYAADILRMHWNPFHVHLDQRMLEFMSLEAIESPETESPEGEP